MGIKETALGRFDVFRLALNDIHTRDGWNVRDVDFNPSDPDDLSLASSIAENGVKEPLTVVWHDDKAYLTNGHRRRAAALYARDTLGAEIVSLPVQTEERYSSQTEHVLSMITRNSGKPLTPLEQARVYKRLFDLGMNETDIAKRVGRSRQHVVDMLGLNAAPVEVTKMVRNGELSATLAVQTIAREGDAATTTLTQAVERAKSEGRTRATAKHVDKPASKADQLRTLMKGVAFGESEGKYYCYLTPDEYASLRSLVGF